MNFNLPTFRDFFNEIESKTESLENSIREELSDLKDIMTEEEFEVAVKIELRERKVPETKVFFDNLYSFLYKNEEEE